MSDRPDEPAEDYEPPRAEDVGTAESPSVTAAGLSPKEVR